MDLISYPFRLTPTGQVATSPDGSDAAHTEELAVAVLTRPGERVLVPDFGIADPVFAGFDGEALRLHVDLFGPPVVIDDLTATYQGDTTQDVVVAFHPKE